MCGANGGGQAVQGGRPPPLLLSPTEQAPVCPVQALLHYIGIRPATLGPLFMLSTGLPLTRAYLVANLQSALRQACMEDKYNGHSFWIGAATTAAQRGLEDSLIQTLGRWRSDTYKLYIKLPRTQLVRCVHVHQMLKW